MFVRLPQALMLHRRRVWFAVGRKSAADSATASGTRPIRPGLRG